MLDQDARQVHCSTSFGLVEVHHRPEVLEETLPVVLHSVVVRWEGMVEHRWVQMVEVLDTISLKSGGSKGRVTYHQRHLEEAFHQEGKEDRLGASCREGSRQEGKGDVLGQDR